MARAIMADPASDALRAEMGKHSDPAAAVAEAAAQRELDSAESVAQVLQWRLEGLRSQAAQEALGGPLPWLPAVPDAADGKLRDWTADRAQVIAARTVELAGRVDTEQPDWAACLGDRPIEPALALEWDRAAGVAASYREQFHVADDSSALGPDRPTDGMQKQAWIAADDVLRLACPQRQYAQISDSSLTEMVSSLTSQQTEILQRTAKAEAYIAEHGEAVGAGCGPFVTAALEDVQAHRERVANDRAAAYARELAEQVKASEQRLGVAREQLAGISGLFSGGKRKALGEEITTLQAEHAKLQQDLQAARAMVKPEGPVTIRDASPEATKALADQMIERAAKADAARLELAQRDVERAPASLEQTVVELQQVSDELAARERNPALAVPDDDHALGQEQVQGDLEWEYQPTQEVDQDRGMER